MGRRHQVAVKKVTISKPNIALVMDTNLLFTKSGFHLGSIPLKNFLVANTNIQLFLPQIVIDERRQHLLEEGIELLKNLNAIKKRLSSLVEDPAFKTMTAEKTIEEAIQKNIQDWIIEVNAKTWTTPVDEIDLKNMIDQSVRKHGVFEQTRLLKNDDVIEVKEKGFKDYLILKTIEKELAALAPYKYILLVSDDRRLRDELDKLKSPSGTNLKTFAKWPEVEEFIKVIYNEISEARLEKLRPKFIEAFERSLKKNAENRIRNSIASEYRYAQALEMGSFRTLSVEFKIKNSTFSSSTEHGVFTWKTEIEALPKVSDPFSTYGLNAYIYQPTSAYGVMRESLLSSHRVYEMEWSGKLHGDVITDLQLVSEPKLILQNGATPYSLYGYG